MEILGFHRCNSMYYGLYISKKKKRGGEEWQTCMCEQKKTCTTMHNNNNNTNNFLKHVLLTCYSLYNNI